MTSRAFADPSGTVWTVWDVRPQWVERRAADRRRRDDGPPPHVAELFGDRRRPVVRQSGRRSDLSHPSVELRVPIQPEYVHGWLAFESPRGDRRRLAPIPSDWEALPDHALCALCARAVPTARRRST